MTDLSDRIKSNDPYYDELVLMSDIYAALMGKKICVYTTHPNSFTGTLETINDFIIVINQGTGGTIYINKMSIIAIVEF